MHILIAGLGSIAQKHIHAIRQLHPDARITALRSGQNKEPIDGIEQVYHIGELKEKIDYAIICTPTHMHAQTITDLLVTGAPLMIEKPLFDETEGREELMQTIERSGITTYVACNLRFHPAIQFLHKEIGNKRINEVNIYCGSYLPDWRPGKDFRKIYSANAEMGGGVHIDLIHELDYASWLFGQPEKVHGIKRNVSALDITAVDFAAFHLLYPQFTVNITLNYYRRDAKRQIEICFDNDTWTANLLTCEVKNSKGELLFSKPGYVVTDTYYDQMAYFVSCIQQHRVPFNQVAEAYGVLKAALH